MKSTYDKHLLTLNGVERTVTDWSRIRKIPAGTIYGRIKRGKTVEECLTPGKLLQGETWRRHTGMFYSKAKREEMAK